MTAEASRTTVNRFSKTWNQTDSNSLVAEFISISKETNREPDSYYFLYEDGTLLDPNTGRPILDFIAEGVEKDIARSLQSWAVNDEGMALWVSPKDEGVYPCPKIIIHRLAYLPNGQKVVLNSAILFDGEIQNSDNKRRTLYTCPDTDENILKVLSFIKRKSGAEVKTDSTSKTSSEKAFYFADKIKAGVHHFMVIQEMIDSGFLGKNPLSCPPKNLLPSSTSFLLSNAFPVNLTEHHHSSEKLCCTCPFCKKQVEAEIYGGEIHCPKCGKSASYSRS